MNCTVKVLSSNAFNKLVWIISHVTITLIQIKLSKILIERINKYFYWGKEKCETWEGERHKPFTEIFVVHLNFLIFLQIFVMHDFCQAPSIYSTNFYWFYIPGSVPEFSDTTMNNIDDGAFTVSVIS